VAASSVAGAIALMIGRSTPESMIAIVSILVVCFLSQAAQSHEAKAITGASTPPQGMRYLWSQGILLWTPTIGSFPKTDAAERCKAELLSPHIRGELLTRSLAHCRGDQPLESRPNLNVDCYSDR